MCDLFIIKYGWWIAVILWVVALLRLRLRQMDDELHLILWTVFITIVPFAGPVAFMIIDSATRYGRR